MTVFEIEDIKKFMSVLLKGEAFDRFLMVEAEIRTAITYRIDGTVNKSFIGDSEPEDGKMTREYTSGEGLSEAGGRNLTANMEQTGNGTQRGSSEVYTQDFCRWESVKGLCTEMIKGKRPPLKLRITMKKPVADENDGRFSYILNLLYENGKLMLVTNVTAVSFSLERPDNDRWTAYVANILKKGEIAYEIIQ